MTGDKNFAHSSNHITLNNINQVVSYQDGDQHVLDAAKILKHVADELPNSTVFRLNGGTFVLLAPYDVLFLNKARLDLIDNLSQKENSLHINGYANLAIVAVEQGTSLGEVLSLLDTGCTIGEDTPQSWRSRCRRRRRAGSECIR